jgi:lipoprotein-releasing system ATP-binding protein
VARRFQTGTETLEVLRSVNLEVEAGSIVAITGESGCGKSTLLSLLGGLDQPSAGTIVAAGVDITDAPEAELSAYRNRSVGFVFQFHFLLRDFTALENVTIPGMMGREGGAALRARARALLEEVGLDQRRDAWPLELSGGERQRVAVARALINGPALLLADEPTGNLDERNAGIVEEMLFSLVRKRRMTLVVVTHDAALASRADIRYVLAGGTLSRPPK